MTMSSGEEVGDASSQNTTTAITIWLNTRRAAHSERTCGQLSRAQGPLKRNTRLSLLCFLSPNHHPPISTLSSPGAERRSSAVLEGVKRGTRYGKKQVDTSTVLSVTPLKLGIAPLFSGMQAASMRVNARQCASGLSMNSTLNNPRGAMSLRGVSTQESFVLKIIRQSPDGKRTVEPLLPPEGKSVAVIMAEKCGTKYPNMVPGVEK
ncbi:hypothetical protein DFH08DRAFT_827616 [Mycena albidolilacea]|uniref:Uncharacterized protein n=1 Tax=Mycena albidolilacea TaxID=1033008 RepID=A0AAD6YXP7_9AGAR|nr:hypothetical protein DFH08DRAFT_827616 [Mycena albidolilacea]